MVVFNQIWNILKYLRLKSLLIPETIYMHGI